MSFVSVRFKFNVRKKILVFAFVFFKSYEKFSSLSLFYLNLVKTSISRSSIVSISSRTNRRCQPQNKLTRSICPCWNQNRVNFQFIVHCTILSRTFLSVRITQQFSKCFRLSLYFFVASLLELKNSKNNFCSQIKEPVGSVPPKINTGENIQVLRGDSGQSLNILCLAQSFPTPIFR